MASNKFAAQKLPSLRYFLVIYRKFVFGHKTDAARNIVASRRRTQWPILRWFPVWHFTIAKLFMDLRNVRNSPSTNAFDLISLANLSFEFQLCKHLMAFVGVWCHWIGAFLMIESHYYLLSFLFGFWLTKFVAWKPVRWVIVIHKPTPQASTTKPFSPSLLCTNRTKIA